MIQAYDYWQNREIKYGRDVPTETLGRRRAEKVYSDLSDSSRR